MHLLCVRGSVLSAFGLLASILLPSLLIYLLTYLLTCSLPSNLPFRTWSFFLLTVCAHSYWVNAACAAAGAP